MNAYPAKLLGRRGKDGPLVFASRASLAGCVILRSTAANDAAPDLSDAGPYATGEDAEIAAELGIAIEELRRQRAQDDIGAKC